SPSIADIPASSGEDRAEESPLTAIAEEPAAAEPEPSIAIAPPRAVGNPFGQSAPAVEERGSEIRIAQEAAAESDHAPQFSDLAEDEEAGAPARLDANTVTAAAVSSAAPSARSDLYDRPSSRYSTAAESGS